MDYLSAKFKKKLDVIIGLFGILTITILFLHEKVVTQMWGVDTNWFAYLTMACAFTLGGFYSLRGYKKNINKGINIVMMLVFFIGGGFCILISFWRIIVELNK
jgi:cation transport ATPase